MWSSLLLRYAGINCHYGSQQQGGKHYQQFGQGSEHQRGTWGEIHQLDLGFCGTADCVDVLVVRRIHYWTTSCEDGSKAAAMSLVKAGSTGCLFFQRS